MITLGAYLPVYVSLEPRLIAEWVIGNQNYYSSDAD